MPFAPLFRRLSSLTAGLASSAPRPATPEWAGLDEAEALERAAFGRWATEGGEFVIEFRPDGRYNKARQTPSAWHHGDYEIDRSRVVFADDDGHVMRGEMRCGVLSIGEMTFHRTRQAFNHHS